MEENQHIENKFRESFSGFEQDPPERVWDGLRRVLHPEPKHTGFWSRIIQGSPDTRVLSLWSGIAAAAIILFLLFMWFSYGNHRIIRGHAYAGEEKLLRGTAYLFKVEDKAKPFDSVRHYRSAIVDDEGSYKFVNIAPGNYLLRIVPEIKSPRYKKYQPSWFDQHESPDEAHLIQVKSEDLFVDVHLLPERNIPPQ
jgi:hypothetical protein